MRSCFYPRERLTAERREQDSIGKVHMSSQPFSHSQLEPAIGRDVWLKPRCLTARAQSLLQLETRRVRFGLIDRYILGVQRLHRAVRQPARPGPACRARSVARPSTLYAGTAFFPATPRTCSWKGASVGELSLSSQAGVPKPTGAGYHKQEGGVFLPTLQGVGRNTPITVRRCPYWVAQLAVQNGHGYS